MSFPVTINGSLERALQTYTTEGVPVGTLMLAEGGRKFRFARIPASTTLVPGKLYTGPAINTDLASMAISTQAVGDKTVTITPGGTTAYAANVLAGGWFHVDVPGTAANGSLLYRIASHPAFTAPATCVLTLETTLAVAIAAADTGTATKSVWKDSVIHPASATASAALAGVALSTAVGSANSTFAWLQTGGPAAVIMAASVLVGNNVIAASGTAGSVGPSATDISPVVGVCVQIEGTGEWAVIDLCID